MLNKKGMDGSYIAIGLIIGLVVAVGLFYYLGSNGMLPELFCPVAVPVTP
jgi:hypothetical protein